MTDEERIRLIKLGIEKSKELRKSSGPIAGICGGIADYTGLPAILIRIVAFGSIIFSWGWSIIVYIILYFFMPKANKDYLVTYTKDNRQLISKSTNEINCKKCHSEIKSDRNFCKYCGEPQF